MTRYQLIEQILRAVYGDQPRDDSTITPNLVNQYINQGIAVAVKNQYAQSMQIDGVTYVNNSFYSTFKNLPIVQDSNLLWKVTLPSIPLAIGRNEGVADLKIKGNGSSQQTIDGIPLSVSQKGYVNSMKRIPNRFLYYYEGQNLYILSTLLLNQYTANVTMVSGGGSSTIDINGELNAPEDMIPVIVDYVVKALMVMRQVPQDITNDGVSN